MGSDSEENCVAHMSRSGRVMKKGEQWHMLKWQQFYIVEDREKRDAHATVNRS